MNAEKQIRIRRMCPFCPRFERDINIGRSRENNPETLLTQSPRQALRDLERQFLFKQAQSLIAGPAIAPSMSGIDHNGADLSRWLFGLWREKRPKRRFKIDAAQIKPLLMRQDRIAKK